MLLNPCNFQQTQINTRRKQEKPSTISLCEAPCEICLLQVEPLCTTNFLPRPCWDLITAKNQLFQLCRLDQRLKQTCGSICSLGVIVEAPAVFCQHLSFENTLGLRQVQVQSILNPSRSTPTHTTTWHTEENKKTFNQFSLRGTQWNLPSSSLATWHHELFATMPLGSENSVWKPTLPGVTTGSRLEANLRLHLLLGCHCRSTCSVLPESICRKHLGTTTSPGTIHLKPIQVNSNSYDNFTHRRKQENLQPILSARHPLKWAFFKLDHLAPWSFCHAAAGIRGQLRRSKTSMGEELKHAINSIASKSKRRATAILGRLGPANATLSPAAISSVEVEGVWHVAPSALSWSLWSSSFGMPFAHRSFGQAPSGSCCQAAAAICERLPKCNPSSCVDWLKACRRSSAPCAACVGRPKDLSKTQWDCDTWRYTVYQWYRTRRCRKFQK